MVTRISNQEIVSLTAEDWSEIIAEIGYPNIPFTLAEKRRVYLDYLKGVGYGMRADYEAIEAA